MKKEQTGGPEPRELGQRYPDLDRAREIAVGLFSDKSKLIQLGYTAKQIAFVQPVLRRLEEPGIVKFMTRNRPYLNLENPDDRDAEAAYVYRLPHRQGHSITVWRDESMRDWQQLSPNQRMTRILLATNPIEIFEDTPGQAAHIALFESAGDADDLGCIIPELYAEFTRSPGGLQSANVITNVGRKIGLVATYQAAWVDERTKLEFVARLDTPEQVSTVAYKRLPRVTDERGTVIPFGKRPNISESFVEQILEEQKGSLFSGQLQLGMARNILMQEPMPE